MIIYVVESIPGRTGWKTSTQHGQSPEHPELDVSQRLQKHGIHAVLSFEYKRKSAFEMLIAKSAARPKTSR